MRISICDNEQRVLDHLKKIIHARYPDDEIDCYSDVQNFIDYSDKVLPYDLVLMDIVFDSGINGINAGGLYQSRHPESHIIFITAYGDRFAQDIFSNVTPCGYLYKPVDTSRLFSLIADVKNKICTSVLKVQPIGEPPTEIRQNDIIYIESDKRKVHIHISRSELSCYDKLDNIQDRLSDLFIRCHKSYIVNLTKVASLDAKTFVLYNGVRIPISQARFADSKASFFRLLGMYLE